MRNFKVNNLVTSSVFILLCNHYLNIVQKWATLEAKLNAIILLSVTVYE